MREPCLCGATDCPRCFPGCNEPPDDCKVEQIAAHVIILRGYTYKPRHITAYCVYANAEGQRP